MVEDVAPQEVGLSDAGSFDFRLRFSCHPLYLLLAIPSTWHSRPLVSLLGALPPRMTV